MEQDELGMEKVALVDKELEMDSELEPTERLDRLALSIQQEIGSSATIVQEAVADSLVSAYIEQGIKAANEESVSRAAKVQKFCILPIDFSLKGGELTPTMKLKRKVVLEKYGHLVDQMYQE